MFGWSRRGAGMLLAVLICAVLAVSGLDSTASAQTGVDYDADDDGLIEVTTEAQLNAIRWDLDGNGAVEDSANATTYSAAFPTPATNMGCPGAACAGYELAANITLTSNTGMGWEPIGDGSTGTPPSFTATFEGNGHTISNLFINRTTDNVGLFGATGSASAIRNVKLTSVDVTGNDNVGALVGLNGDVTDGGGPIDNCEAAGTVTGNAAVGGLVGKNYGPIAGSSASVAVTSTRTDGSALAGGLVGQNLQTTISNSHATGDVTASHDTVGGLVGSNYDDMASTTTALPRNAISGSTASGTVTTTGNEVGGLVGWNNGPISDSDALNPSVTGVSYVGGLVGQNDGADGAAGSNAISGSTASGTVTATGSFAGGLVGSNEGPISDSDALNLSVTGLSWVGGLVGFNANAWPISGSTARGPVTASGSPAGGLVGQNTGPISGSSATGTVTGRMWVGGLVGLNNGPISGSSASGEVTATRTDGASRAGGLVGENRSTPISNSHASGDVTGSHDMVGGLVGHNLDELASTSSTPPRNAISGSTASGTVTTTGSEVGGLVGWNNGPISDSAALNPSVTGVNSVGGLVGTNVDDEDRENGIDRSIATANVMGTGAANGTGQHVGGLVGFSYGPIRDSYASGAVRGNYQVGGLAGNNVAGVHNSRADGEVGAGNAAVAAERMGGLVGYSDGRIVGGVATGAVTGSAASSALGGLVGHSRGSISSSAATGAVSGGQQVGGLVGYVATTGTVTESWASGAVTAIALASALQSGTNVGGLVGWSDGTVGASFATGNVTGVGSAGGLLGLNTGGVIATYATGSVTVSDNASCTGLSCPRVAGGLIGLARKQLDSTSTGSDVQASYSTGSVSGPSGHVVGGLAGKAGRETTPPSYSASFTDSYWDNETSGPTFGVGSDDEDGDGVITLPETATAGVTGQTTAALKAPTGYTSIFANWNVTITGVTARVGGPWDFGAATDYPVLRGLGAPPSVPAGTATLSVAEERLPGISIGSPLTATDADSSTLSYKLVGAGGVFFSIESTTGQLSTKTFLDYENPVDANRDNRYEFMVQASDGMTVAFRTVTVTITNVNEAPAISGPATINVDEGHTGTLGMYGTDDPELSLTNWGFIGDNLALSGPDSDFFRFDKETGQLTFAAPPDFEGGGGQYEVTVDANDGELHGMLEVTVNVVDVEEPGTLTFEQRHPVVGQPTTATLTEPDGVVGAVTWTWQRSTSASGGWTEIATATSRSYTPVTDDVDNYLRATATYEDGYGPGKTLQTVTDFTTAAANSMNATPMLLDSVDAIELPENARPGMDAGSPVQATDSDGDPISYSLTGDSEFLIDQRTGQIKVAPDAAFDFDAGRRRYSVTVTASDGFGASDTVGVTITITNVDEPPVAADDAPLGFDEDTAATIDVLANDSDPEDAKSALTVSVVSEPARGMVVVNPAATPRPTITYTPQANYNGSDSFSYRVTDSDGLTSNVATVALTIYALNDAPEFPATTPTARSVPEEATGGALVGAPVTAVDVDGDDLTYSLAGSASFEMLDGTAQITVREGAVLDATNEPTHMVTVTADDGNGPAASIDVTITVTTGPVIPPINEPPVAADDAPLSFDEDTSIEIRVLENDSDPEDAKSALTVSVVRGPARGMVVVNDAVDPDGPTITYTPQANYNGADSFSYRVTDSGGLTSNVATVVLTIDALNDAPEFPATTPTARSVSERAQYGDPVGAPVTAVDVDGDDLTYSLVGSTDFEMLDGTAQITVRDGVALDATDQPTTVTVTVADERGATASIAVTITVTADDDDVPVTVSFGLAAYSADEGDTVMVTVTLSVDPEREVVIPLTATDQNGASPADYSGVPANLTFNAGEMSKSFTFTATQDAINDDGEMVLLAFGPSLPAGVSVGTTVTTTVSIDDAGVSVSNDSLTIAEGSSGTYTIVLRSQPTADVTVTINDPTDNTDVTADPASLTFSSSDWNSPKTVTVNAVQDADAADETATVTHTVTSTDSSYSGATANSVAVTVTDDENVLVQVTVMFGASTYTVAEGGTVAVTVTLSADPERRVVIPLTATDQNGASPADYSGVPANLTFNAGEMSKSFTFTATQDAINDDGEMVLLGFGTSLPAGVTAGTTVTTTVSIGDTVAPITPPSGAGGGGGGGFSGGGGGGGPSPSVVDFEWNVTRDIDELDSGHDKPSGLWSDGTTLWLLENGDGTDNAVYAYDLATGERVEDREFELDNTNRAPRGVWSDRTLLWVSDSGRNSLFAHDLASGERAEERDIALAGRNRDARGIWSGDGTMWVLDGGKDSVFAYDLASGALLAEYELASANGDPHGLWSDQTTVWVSDHGAKRLFAYRLPVPDAEEVDGEDLELERVRDEEFPNTVLSRASNNSPRGLWSDGDVMYVVDASDGKVYTYNMPDAIDARLSSLTLSGVDIGEFSPNREDYEGVAGDALTVTTVEAAAVQDDAVVVIDPPDADEAADGRQVAVGGGAEITVTVTSADGSREKTYRVRIEETGPSASCLRGAVAEGFSLVVSEGGSIEDLVACAEGRAVTALYTLDGGEYVSYILGAPATVNEGFDALYANGVPALTPLIAKSEGPPSPAPASDAVREFGPDCLRGEIVEGFNLVLYEGGSVGDLEACADEVGVAALYVLADGVWVSYILGAPEPVNATFRELFADGLPVATPLVGKRD